MKQHARTYFPSRRGLSVAIALSFLLGGATCRIKHSYPTMVLPERPACFADTGNECRTQDERDALAVYLFQVEGANKKYEAEIKTIDGE